MNRAHNRSQYLSQNADNWSSYPLATLSSALREIASKKGGGEIEWADELKNRYGNKWLSKCADKLDPKLLSLINDKSFL